MESNTQGTVLHKVQRRLHRFFPEQVYALSAIQEGLDSRDLFYQAMDILPYLQSALLDEKILEVELDGLTRVYFSRVYDDPPAPEELDHAEDDIATQPDYRAGDYLKQMSHLITLPIEPGIGNLFVKNANQIMIRLFTTNYAVELGTFFQQAVEVSGLPVLRFDFPVIGRIVRGAREFRAKVPHSMNLLVLVMGKRKHATIRARVTNISASGLAFAIAKQEQELFRMDELRTLELVLDDIMLVRINARVRHVSKVRGGKGTEFICGLQFDLETRLVASQVESLVAQVQRAHLKELYDLSEESGLNLIA